MPAFRNHYREIILLVLIFTLLGSWSFVPHLLGPQAEAQSTAEPTEEQLAEVAAAAEQRLAEIAETRDRNKIAELRDDLALRNADLAAMGLTESVATNVLSELRTWWSQNEQALESADTDVRDAQRALQEVMARIRKGPRDASVLAQVPLLEQQVDTKRAQRQQLIDNVIPQIEGLLTFDQKALWHTARLNRDAPARYRYVSGLDSDQKQALRVALRKYGLGSSRVAAVEDSVLWSSQQFALETTQLAVHTNIDQIKSAEDTVFQSDSAE